MITLYEIYWSHYCEKVRWALNFKRLTWTSIQINPFTKRQMQAFPTGRKNLRLVPMIHDSALNSVVYESSAILKYLEDCYPHSPRLFPGSQSVASEIHQKLIEFDSVLAIPARRLGYTQLMLESPTALATLFLRDQWKGVLNWPFINRLSSAVVGMFLIKRFDMHLNEDISLYEKLEAYLLPLSASLRNRQYLFDDLFSAADIGLACQLRPLRIVPFFFEHPGLVSLFRWQELLFQKHGLEARLPYETLIERERKKQPPVRRYIRSYVTSSPSELSNLFPTNGSVQAANDHMPIWTADITKAPYWYINKIRRGKVRQSTASTHIR